jgi:acyl-CoA-binding protein
MACSQVQEVFDKVDQKTQMTFYSLYKQGKEGNAKDCYGAKETMPPIKYSAWEQ